MKRILFLVLTVVLFVACAPKQPKTMGQLAEEARAEAYANTGSPKTLGANDRLSRGDPSFVEECGEDILWLFIDGALLSTGNNDTTGTNLKGLTDK